MQDITLKQLLEAGCHFGHKSERWHPKAQQFIYEEREGIHVIDLAKTKAGLVKAGAFIKETVKSGKEVLFIGTKKQAAQIVKEEAGRVSAPFISKRWIGGFLTNWTEVHKNLEKIRKLSEEEKNDAWKKYPKHERVKLSRYLSKLKMFYGGVIELRQLPEVVFVIDVKREAIAVHEAKKMNLIVVGVVDTNSDPTQIDYQIPANDDATGSINFLVKYLTDCYKEGKVEFEKSLEDSKTVRQEDNKMKKTEEKKVEVKKAVVLKTKEEVKKAVAVKPKKEVKKETKK
jgi:small subunit ribosomal protein S2